ncbi:MAG: gamma-glutamyl-gamma-aminobutyrate hydrolase family protein [Nitrospirae bacterium]|jgi:putative glutamine amidotransferase|nr:gamma-glutamyl-gamma-aminobutyrate hydrolase family protein [Nitrospirota bacterium]
MKPIIGITADMDEHIFRLRQDYVSAVEKSGGLPLILAPTGDISQIADFIDGLLLPGGDDLLPEYYGEDISVPLECLKIVRKERSDFEISLLKEVVKRQKPVLAICYGMQLANVAFGGSLYQDIEAQVEGDINHRSEGHDIKIVQPSVLDLQPSTFSVNSSHHQAVKRLADGFEVFAVSGDGIIEGIYKRDYTLFIGVQWHPERIFYDKLSLGIFEGFIEQAKGKGG